MTSLLKSTRQTPSKYFISVGDCRGKIYINTGTDAAPTVAAVAGTGSSGGWATEVSTVISGAGALFRDMGKQFTSAGQLFRKVQLIYAGAGTTSTFGVGGSSAAATTTVAGDYLSCYIQLPGTGVGTDLDQVTAGSAFTPVARLG